MKLKFKVFKTIKTSCYYNTKYKSINQFRFTHHQAILGVYDCLLSDEHNR